MDSISLDWIDLQKFVAPALVLAISIIIGMALQHLVSKRVLKLAAKTKWRGDDIIIHGFKGKVFLWTLIIGAYSALPMLNLPDEYNSLIQKILLVLVILSVTFTVSSILSGFIRHYAGEEKGGVLSTSIFAIIARVVIMSIGLMIILQSLNISITPMLTALGVGGLAVALALQDTLSNLFAGFHILLTRRVRVGDWVELESGEAGEVIDITWRNTTIRQRRNNIIIIPNSTVASSIMTNYNLPLRELHIRVEVGVSYDSDLEHVEKVTEEVGTEVMNEVKGGVPSHKPFIRYHSFGDSSINFYVNLKLQSYTDQFRVRHEFIKRLHKRFNKEGIVIPFPIRTLDLPKGNFAVHDEKE
jgi:small-conductance mechanosensitive channel